ncbi:MAG: metallophosphoesterase [Labilithrix sp.]|nr:metallophosphoesterase [Labilithrix sp.]
MWPIFPGSLTVMVIGAMLVLVLLAMRIVQPAWWSARPARVGVLVAFGGMLVGVALWGAGRSLDDLRLVHTGAGIAYVGVLVILPAAIVMPVAALIDRVLVRVTHPAVVTSLPSPPAQTTPRLEMSRRTLIRLGSTSLPAMAAMGGASGLVTAQRDPTMPVIRLRWPGLHPDLVGLRILHLSDLHLGVCLGLEDLERALRVARATQRPDLIVLTGDLADDASLIPAALRLIAEARPRHGAFASLGNHEYLHDIAVTRPLYESSPVPLVCASGRSVRIGRSTLFVGGADDPVHMGGDIPWFLTPSIEAAAAEAPLHADFRLLLCHRPEGHGPAATNGFDLTLSGHTHGGQLGMFGRSVLEKIKPGIGWWGSYAKKRPPEIARARAEGTSPGPGGPSRLYTTSGFGHWFPFRFGCPTEMPLIVLEGDPRPRSSSDRA